MSILTQYKKTLFVEIVLKLVHLAVGLPVDCILYRRCVLEFTAGL